MEDEWKIISYLRIGLVFDYILDLRNNEILFTFQFSNTNRVIKLKLKIYLSIIPRHRLKGNNVNMGKKKLFISK